MTVLLCKVPLVNHTEKNITVHSHKSIKPNSEIFPSGAHISRPHQFTLLG